MSCQNNANHSAQLALKCGIVKAAGIGGYMAGAWAGAALGGTAGRRLGPLGTTGGALVGGTAAYGLLKRVKAWRTKRRAEKAAQRAWLASQAGRRATTDYSRKLAAAQQRYTAALNKLKLERARFKADYELAREQGLAESGQLKTAKSMKEAIRSPEVKAAAGQALSGAMAVGAHYALEGRTMARNAAIRAAFRGVANYGATVDLVREKMWLETPAGQAAAAQYEEKLRAWQQRKAALTDRHQLQLDKIETAYNNTRQTYLQKRTSQRGGSNT